MICPEVAASKNKRLIPTQAIFATQSEMGPLLPRRKLI